MNEFIITTHPTLNTYLERFFLGGEEGTVYVPNIL